jgi:hypothetical protein
MLTNLASPPLPHTLVHHTKTPLLSVVCASFHSNLQVRFDFFCKAALEFLLKTGRQPDILHCHDWSTAHVAKSFWEDYQPYGLYKPKVGAGGGGHAFVVWSGRGGQGGHIDKTHQHLLSSLQDQPRLVLALKGQQLLMCFIYVAKSTREDYQPYGLYKPKVGAGTCVLGVRVSGVCVEGGC